MPRPKPGKIKKKNGEELECDNVSWNVSFAFCKYTGRRSPPNEAVPAHKIENMYYD